MTALPGMFDLSIFGKIWKCSVLTLFIVRFLAAEVDSSSFFSNLYMMLLTVALCFLVGSSFSFSIEVL